MCIRDRFKLILSSLYRDGLFDEIGEVPRLIVHDEFDFSYPLEYEKLLVEMGRRAETVWPLLVPLKMDVGVGGLHWGALG